jgi:hypothetical protein
VPPDDVADLVADGSGKLVEPVRLLDQSSVDVDDAPGSAKALTSPVLTT